MFKNLFLIFLLLFSSTSIFYPAKKENTKLFDYCYSLENILVRNSIKTKKKLPNYLKSIAGEITEFGVDRTKGVLINKIINKYKKSKNIYIIKILPNKVLCLGGYWIETIIPGTFENTFYIKSKNSIQELKDLKIEADQFINNINSEYKNIRKEFYNLFD